MTKIKENLKVFLKPHQREHRISNSNTVSLYCVCTYIIRLWGAGIMCIKLYTLWCRTKTWSRIICFVIKCCVLWIYIVTRIGKSFSNLMWGPSIIYPILIELSFFEGHFVSIQGISYELLVISPAYLWHVSPTSLQYRYLFDMGMVWVQMLWYGYKSRPNHVLLLCLELFLGRTLIIMLKAGVPEADKIL